MAANDYYNSSPYTNKPAQSPNLHGPLPPLPFNSSPSLPNVDPHGYSMSGATTPPDHSAYSYYTPPAHHSQQSLGSDTTYYGPVSGRIPNQSGDSDEIPLRPHPQQTDAEAWAAQNAGPPPAQPLPKRRGRKKDKPRSFFKRPWVVYCLTIVQVAVFIAELVKNGKLTGSPIMIHPTFNPMIGPSTYVLINMGARFVPCMKALDGVQNAKTPINWPCPNCTTSDATSPTMQCSLSELCGFSGVPNPKPNGSLSDQPQPDQWFRFIVPIFLHAGFIHIGFNMLLQWLLGSEMELSIGSLRFALVYFSSGIFGFVLGGNYAATGIASTGASGCLFGILALNILELLYTWKTRRSPGVELIWILVEVVISFVLGLLPGLDNFSHIGGFLMGLVLGICLLRSPDSLRQRTGQGDPPYAPVVPHRDAGQPSFAAKLKSVPGFFKHRKPLWWAWWLIRAAALIGVLIGFIALINSFYTGSNTCKWCKYLSCLPVKGWCDIGNLHLGNSTSSNNNKRDLFGFDDAIFL
ncbi:rhomboid-domain-containing protein [Xylona heveae TC161]|uniref:Rhomboid-type serine protease n=1 Tax=Xylona heveae (strain CBS 132557 / TC161) TaxID=1328760 RepID=A0A165JRV1_XYLHT|nr:rhomboid-domain-containing protein [Xylona heveae TC161]KZF26552.1 rhomboid-domain-containing protein [Xylona heveae TC161]